MQRSRAAGYVTLAVVAKCLRAATWLVACGNQEICAYIIHAARLFKLNMVITSIIILCVIAMGLYQGIQYLEHLYKKKK